MGSDIRSTTVIAPRRDSDESQSVTSPRVDSAAPSTIAAPGVPPHPCPVFQAAFEESILEADDDPPSILFPPEPETRRQELVNAKRYDDNWVARWRQRRGARCHPLQKLMAQIVFGIHLLQQQQARSSEEVVKILQSHVNEVDSFLERAADDLELAAADIDERLRHLRLPLEHIDVFKMMLDDAAFRSQLLEGNGKIEKIVDRTTRAKQGILYDAEEGIRAVHELSGYLSDVEPRWPRKDRNIAQVFEAMRGNEEGWLEHLADLQAKANTLETCLAQLNDTLLDMASLAIEATSKGSATPAAPSSVTGPALRSKFSSESNANLRSDTSGNKNKPLPTAPRVEAVKATSPSPERHREATKRLAPVSVTPGRTLSPLLSSPDLTRPQTFDRTLSPLRSNPPYEGFRGTNSSARSVKSVKSAVDMDAFVDSAPVPRRPDSHTRGPVVGERGSSARGHTAGSEYASSINSESQLPRTGFARRMSRRMKHLPQANTSMRMQASDPSLYSSAVSNDVQSPKRTAVTKPSLPNIFDNEDDEEHDGPPAFPAFSRVNPPRTVNATRNTTTNSLRSLNMRTSVLAAKDKAMNLRHMFHRRGAQSKEASSLRAM